MKENYNLKRVVNCFTKFPRNIHFYFEVIFLCRKLLDYALLHTVNGMTFGYLKKGIYLQ